MAIEAAVNGELASVLCPLCGTGVGRSSAKVLDAHRLASGAPVLDDLAAARWVQAYDAAWLGQDWDGLASLLAPGVEFVVPGLAEVLIGRPAIIESLRNALSRMVIHEYNATDLTGYDRWPVGIIMYRWQLDCSAGQQRVQSTGRDVLVLTATDDRWALVWRGQFNV
jgi:Domain of unknown function (DUF4440)